MFVAALSPDFLTEWSETHEHRVVLQPTKCMFQNFDIGDLRAGQFWTTSYAKSMGKYRNAFIVIKAHGIGPNLSRSYYWWPFVMMKVQLFISGLCKVVRSHQRPPEVFINCALQNEDRDVKQAPMCFSCPYASNDIRNDLFQTYHDLDLRSNFQIDLLRSSYISFEPTWWEKYNGSKILTLHSFHR